jgi:rhamnosyltransferase
MIEAEPQNVPSASSVPTASGVTSATSAPSALSAPGASDASLALSAVIRSRSASGDVLEAVEALAAQTCPPDEFVVIDSGSAPAVRERLRSWAEWGVPRLALEEGNGASPIPNLNPTPNLNPDLNLNPDPNLDPNPVPTYAPNPASIRIPFRLIEIPGSEFQSARALNQAITAARGSLVAILSQDALPADARYLEHLVAAMADPGVAGAYGRQVLGTEYHALGEKDLEKTYPPVSRTQVAPDCWFVNTCSIVRRDLFEQHPFDEAALISEDHEWGRWAQEQGYVLKYVAESVVRHYHHFARWSDLWARYREEGRGLARIHGRRLSLAQAAYFYAREVASDALWLVSRGHAAQIPASIARRAVKFAALYWGGRR